MNFLSDDLWVFSAIAGVTVVLAVFEVLLLVLGLSSLGEADGGIAGDTGAGGLDVDGDIPELGMLSPAQMSLLDINRDDRAEYLKPRKTGMRRFLSQIGLGNGPLVGGLACMAAGVSSLGFALQFASEGLTGRPLPGTIALLIVLYPGLRIAGGLTKWMARLMPGIESQAISGNAFNGRRGVITSGTARAGMPVQVRWYDLYGTMHHTMAEPFIDGAEIAERKEVLLLRTKNGDARIIETN